MWSWCENENIPYPTSTRKFSCGLLVNSITKICIKLFFFLYWKLLWWILWSCGENEYILIRIPHHKIFSWSWGEFYFKTICENWNIENVLWSCDLMVLCSCGLGVLWSYGLVWYIINYTSYIVYHIIIYNISYIRYFIDFQADRLLSVGFISKD